MSWYAVVPEKWIMSQPIIGRGRVLVFQFVPKTNNTIRKYFWQVCWLDMHKFWRKNPKCFVQSEARVAVSNFESSQQITTPFQNPVRHIFGKCGDFIWSSFWEENWKYLGQTDARVSNLPEKKQYFFMSLGKSNLTVCIRCGKLLVK